MGQYGNFGIKLVKLQKFESLGECNAKIETLEVELKIVQNLRGKVQFPQFFNKMQRKAI